jgi:hypothetical protein
MRNFIEVALPAIDLLAGIESSISLGSVPAIYPASVMSASLGNSPFSS